MMMAFDPRSSLGRESDSSRRSREPLLAVRPNLINQFAPLISERHVIVGDLVTVTTRHENPTIYVGKKIITLALGEGQNYKTSSSD